MKVGFISIYKSDLLGVKIEIYYQTMRVITKDTYNHRQINIINKFWFFCLALGALNWLNIIALEIVVIESLLMMCIDRNVW